MQSQVRFNKVPEKVPECRPTAPRCLMLAPTLLQIAHLQPQDASCWPQLCRKLPTYSPKMPHVGPNSAANCPPTAPRCLMLAPTLLQIADLQPQDASCWPQLCCKLPTYSPGVGGFGAEPGQVQQGSGEGSGEGSRKLWCKAKWGSTGSREGCETAPGKGFGNLWRRARSGQGFQRLATQHASERFGKIKRCGCWGYNRNLFWKKEDCPHFWGEHPGHDFVEVYFEGPVRFFLNL